MSLDLELKKAQQLMAAASLDEAGSVLSNLQKKHPSQINIQNLLGQVYLRQKKFKEAITCFEKSLRYSSKDTMIIFLLALAYEGEEQYSKAIELCKKAIRIDANFGLAYYNLARILVKDCQQYAAIDYFKKALETIKDNPEIYAGLACSYNDIGLWHLAKEYFDLAYEISGQPEYFTSPILISHKNPESTLADLQRMAAAYYEKMLSKVEVKRDYDFSSRSTSKTRYRIGFVSGDYKSHPVGLYLVSVLERLDKTKFEVFLYYSSKSYDAVTERLQNATAKFTSILKIDDHTAADMIYEDEVDILVDLSGYTFGERLGIFRLKPAPVQVAHLGYPGTLAIPQIDFIFADNTVVKEGEEQFFTETVYRFPGVFTHAALFNMPEASMELPYSKNKFITFGCMNTFHKVSELVIATWSQILQRVENSVLVFDSQTLSSECNREFVWLSFEKYGINRDRIKIRSNEFRKDFLPTYNELDIVLDTFPYSGGTSTIESCMMGVPLITIEGNTWVSRMAATKLKTTGHPELVVSNIQDYINEYVKLAQDPARIENYRKNLRSDMENSRMNIELYVKDFEKAFEDIWRLKFLH